MAEKKYNTKGKKNLKAIEIKDDLYCFSS